jgi:hypothetical protein
MRLVGASAGAVTESADDRFAPPRKPALHSSGCMGPLVFSASVRRRACSRIRSRPAGLAGGSHPQTSRRAEVPSSDTGASDCAFIARRA